MAGEKGGGDFFVVENKIVRCFVCQALFRILGVKSVAKTGCLENLLLVFCLRLKVKIFCVGAVFVVFEHFWIMLEIGVKYFIERKVCI